jgi:Sec-independent protein translocase protein TatA
MFDLGSFGELFIIVAAFFILINPKDMPRLLSYLVRLYNIFKKYVDKIRHQVSKIVSSVDLEKFENDVYRSTKIKSKKKDKLKFTNNARDNTSSTLKK